jgi:hypothetical protein
MQRRRPRVAIVDMVERRPREAMMWCRKRSDCQYPRFSCIRFTVNGWGRQLSFVLWLVVGRKIWLLEFSGLVFTRVLFSLQMAH